MGATTQARTFAAGTIKLCPAHRRQWATASMGERDRIQAGRQPPAQLGPNAGPSSYAPPSTSTEHRWYPVVRYGPHRRRFRPHNR